MLTDATGVAWVSSVQNHGETPMLSVRRIRSSRGGIAILTVATLVASLLWIPPAAAYARGGTPPGASLAKPAQASGSAAGRSHSASAAATSAGKAEPAGRPAPPPGTKGVVGDETKLPDPVTPASPMCHGCGMVTPTFPPKGGAPPVRQPATMHTAPTLAAPSRGFVAGKSRELPQLRTARTTTFANPDGTRTLRTYAGPTYAKDASGAMVPIDTNLAAGSDGRYRPDAAQAVSFARSSTDGQLATIRLDDGTDAGFALSGVAPVTGVAGGPDMRYPNVSTDADFALTATAVGFQDKLILRSAEAATVWRFPLRLNGLTPQLAAGAVRLVDKSGAVRGVIPPGYMVDSAGGPQGQGARSNNVTYQLVQENGGWTLVMTLDQAWLRSPQRVFPVTADPTVRYPAYDDTYVTSAYSQDLSSLTTMSVGWNTGQGDLSQNASYVRFVTAESLLYRKYILGASMSVYTLYSKCTPAPMSVYPVSNVDWFGSIVTSWPGPAYDPTPIGTATFARRTACGDAAGWDTVQIDPARLQNLVGSQAFKGFTLRASSTDLNGFKVFYTSEQGAAPFLDVVYADEGADITLDSGQITPPVTPSTSGNLLVWSTNRGSSDWTATNGFKLVAIVTNSAGTEVARSSYAPSGYPVTYWGWASYYWVQLGPLPAGSYSVRLTMQDPAGHLYDDYYGNPRLTATFTVLTESDPVVTGISPPNNAQVDSLRPSLWSGYYDADQAPGGPFYWYRVCNGTPSAPTGCVDSGWVTNPVWTVPAGLMGWGKTSLWYVALSDTHNTAYLQGPYGITPTVAQPEITNHLAGAGDDADAAGLSPSVGNYSTEVVDASVAVAGPRLEIRRTYNSQDPRGTGAFGPGWSSPLDQKVTVDPDGSGNVVVTLASGRQVRFGLNADGSFAPPPGQNMTLVHGTGSWTLRDPTGETRVFTDAGQLSTVSDGYGRQQQYLYTSGLLSQIKDVASGRSLWLTWSGGRISTVKSDAPVAGGAQPTWTYTYDTSGRLAKACSPLSANACVQYQYQTSSHYRSMVTDGNPVAYYPLAETSGSTAVNVMAHTPGELYGSYTNVGLNQAGALAGTSDPAVWLDGTKPSAIVMPDNLVTSSMAFALEMWFKAAPGKNGVLYSEQDRPLNATPGHHAPALYVRTDGLLHGSFWSPSGGEIVTAGRVDDGAWHHVVLSVNIDHQDLYLDGALAGTLSGHVINHLDMAESAVGNGSTSGWAGGVAGNQPFTGFIDDFAVYRHPMGALQVSAHYAARLATSRLVKVIEPGSFTAMTATYDAGSGRVATMADRNGALWTLTAPVVGNGTRTVSISASGHEPVTYTYDATRGGRLMSRKTSAGTEVWAYDANGFVSQYTNANNKNRFIYRDARGNITQEAVYGDGMWQWKAFGYYLNTADPLDPRNDRLVWRSGARNSWDGDPTNRIVYEMDAVGRTTKVTYPRQSGSEAQPVETNAFTAGTEAALGGGTVPAGLPATYTNRLGGTTTYTYNSRGDLLRSVDPAGLTTDYTYDLLGRAVSRTTSAVVNSQTVTYGTWATTYNAASLVDTETAPAVTNPVTGVTHTARTTNTYDDSGHLTRKVVSDTTGGDAARTWSYGFDAAGHQHTATDPTGAVTTQDWNTAGDLARVTQPNGLANEYKYDDRRHLVETDAVGTGVDPTNPTATRMVVESRSYDPAGQLASVVDAMGRETAYTYLDNGSVATKSLVRRDSTGAITSSTSLAQYGYDYGGQLARETDAGGVVIDYDTDDEGNQYRKTIDAGGLARTTAYTYAADGSVATRTDSSGITFLAARPTETPYLFNDNGSKVDGGGDRYADATATFTYRFVLPSDTAHATLKVEVDNEFLVQLSSDNQTWTDVAKETNVVKNGSNRIARSFSLDSYLATSKTVYLRFGDSQPADGWGAAVTRVDVDYNRSGQQALRTTYGYNTSGRQTSATVTNPGGTPTSLVTSTVYDPRGLPTQTTDPNGGVTKQSYDVVGNLSTLTQPARTVWRDGVRTDGVTPVTTAGWNTFGDKTETKDANGAVTRTAVDGMGRPIQVTLPSYTPPGGTALTPRISGTYNAAGQPTQVTDPLGRSTVSTYDIYGRPITKTEPDPDGTGPQAAPVWRYSYDRDGELLQTTDPTGATSSATYNDLGYRDSSTVSDRIGGTTVYYTTTLGRDDAGLLLTEKTPLGHVTTHAYDKAGEPTVTTDATSRTTETRYDALGRVTAQIVGGVRATGFAYDEAGRTLRQTSHTVSNGQLSAPLRTAQVSYDGLGQPLTVTSPEGRVTSYTYDAGGNRTSVSQRTNPADPASAVTVQIGYDALGNRTRMVDGNGNATDYLYNDWGMPTVTREPSTPDGADREWTTVYDAGGQAVRLLAPGGVTQNQTYDGLGRITSRTGAGGSAATATYATDYDALGRPTRVSSPVGDSTYTWSDRGLLTGSTGPAGTSSFGYDSEGNLTSRTDPAGNATFSYDAAQRLSTATDPLTGLSVSYGYAATGDVASLQYGTGGPSRTFTVDSLGRLATEKLVASDGSTAAATTYGYDNDDWLTSRTTSGLAGAGANAYGYDGLGRLTSWTGPDGKQTSYGYDAASNRTTVTNANGIRTSTYDARNRLVSATGAGAPSATYTWSARGTLESVTGGLTGNTTYTYDAFDHQMSAAAAAGTDNYVYDSQDRLVQRDGASLGYPDLSDNPVSVPGAGGQSLIFRAPDGAPISDKTGANGRLLTTDGVHGDLVAASAPGTGAVLASAAYNPQGAVTAHTGSLPLGFQGGFTEPDTGLVNAQARWYSPGDGQFVSRDTLTLDPSPVAQANRYAYGNGDPIDNADPSGHFAPAAAVAAFFGPIGWTIAAIGLVTFIISCEIQHCHWPFQGVTGPSAFDTPDGQKVGALANAHDPSVRAAVASLELKGLSPAEILAQIRTHFPTDVDVVRVTGTAVAVPSAPAISVPKLNWGDLAGDAAATAAAAAAAAAAADAAAADIIKALTWTPPALAPAPPVQQTITNIRPPEISLLPAGSQLQNVVAGATAAATAAVGSSTLLNNSDGSDGQNTAVAATAGAVAAAAGIADVASPNNGGDDDNKFCGQRYKDIAGKGIGDSHHIVQQAAVRDLKGVKFRDEPATPLEGGASKVGTEHYKATQVQRQYGGGTLGAEFQIALQALIAAGKDPQWAANTVNEAKKYFYNLGFCDSTPTRIPGNRKKTP
jgi:RHS repeat-associated protein